MTALALDSLGEPAVPFPGYTRGRIDDEVVNPAFYATGEIEAVFAKLRAEPTIRLMRPRGYRPFYSIVKHADILEIEKPGGTRFMVPFTPAAVPAVAATVMIDAEFVD